MERDFQWKHERAGQNRIDSSPAPLAAGRQLAYGEFGRVAGGECAPTLAAAANHMRPPQALDGHLSASTAAKPAGHRWLRNRLRSGWAH
jgi:hypothetical protein